MTSTVVRVEAKTHATLRAWAREQKKPISQILTELVERQETERFWQEMHEDFAQLRSNPAHWKDYQDESVVLGGGSMDGLENEDPYYTPEEEAEIEAHAKSQGW